MNGRTKDEEVDEIYTPPDVAKKLLEKRRYWSMNMRISRKLEPWILSDELGRNITGLYTSPKVVEKIQDKVQISF